MPFALSLSEGRFFLLTAPEEKNGPSTSSGRTDMLRSTQINGSKFDMTQSLTNGEMRLPADWRDLFALTKPRVMSLVVFTALFGLRAAPGHVHPVLGFSSILAIALGAGSSGARNQGYEAGTEAHITRTAGCPHHAGRINTQQGIGKG